MVGKNFFACKNLLQSGIFHEYILETSVYPREHEQLKELREAGVEHKISFIESNVLPVLDKLVQELDAVANSPGLDMILEGDALACEEEKDHEQNCGEGNSSRTMTKPKRDRSKTIVSERGRRSRMKEKLFELRSLVPNITKMDKASIISDAVVYVQSLQDQAKKLGDEVSVLESSLLKEDQVPRVPIENLEARQIEGFKNSQFGGKILSVMAQEVGEGKFYVKVECNKGDGLASALYSAIESLECFHVENSDLSFNLDRLVLSLTFNVTRGSGEVMTASSMKLWVMGALLKEGFGFEMSSI